MNQHDLATLDDFLNLVLAEQALGAALLLLTLIGFRIVLVGSVLVIGRSFLGIVVGCVAVRFGSCLVGIIIRSSVLIRVGCIFGSVSVCRNGIVAIGFLVDDDLVIVEFHILKQCFAVSHRDLIVIRVDFRKGEEAVAIAAIFDKRRLQ